MFKKTVRIGLEHLKNLKQLDDIEYPEELQHEACLLAAYDIIKCLYKEGLITESEKNYIREKYTNSGETHESG